FLLFSGRVIFAAAGAALVFDLFYALYSARRPREKRVRFKKGQREYLLAQAGRIWKFFADSHKEKFHNLPPDNLCLSPTPAVAARTSPTNIGLCLCAFLSARDFGFIDSPTLYTMLDETFSSVEKLETSHGNLLNWYDITTLGAMEPAFVSFVDSGNFLCCLIALKEGLSAYAAEEPRLSELARRLEKMIAGCDLSVFYDPVRALFRTGYDARTGEKASSYYDLRISEARMSGFAAVALGLVPVRHLGAPARVGGRYRGAEGLLSWSGTAFEYFMPRLFLPAAGNTLDGESLRFAYLAQRGFGRKNGVPWGVSESCYFAFDESMNYCYKANGVEACALCAPYRGEIVIAPYATFLTLPCVGAPAAENLKRLETFGAVGKYGFYEALDFTPRRGSKDSPAMVRVFMAHHLGMSLLAVQNALFDDTWPRRFTARKEIMAASELLLEGISPVPCVTGRERNVRKTRERRSGPGAGGYPAVLYAGGGLSAAVHESGCVAVYRGGRSVFFPGRDVYREPFGVFAALFCDGKAIPFTPAPLFRSAESGFSVHGKGAVWRSAENGLALRQRFTLSKDGNTSYFDYRIKNKTGARRAFSFCVYAEPSLNAPRGELAHRAYARLFIKSRIDDKRQAVIFERTEENGSFAAVLALDAACIYTTDKSVVFDEIPFDRLPEPNAVAGSVDCCFAARTELELGAHAETLLTLTVCVGETASEATERFDAAAAARGAAAEPVFAREPSRAALLSAFLCELVFCSGEREVKNGSPRRRDLWPAGISGDRPIVAVDAARVPRAQFADIASVSRILNVCGIENELAALVGESDPYYSPLRRETEKLLRGVPLARIADTARLPRTAEAITALAGISFPPTAERNRAPYRTLRLCSPELRLGCGSLAAEEGFYIVRGKGRFPWSGCLANRSFGTLFTNRSLGFTWALNSAENKLTPWFGAPDVYPRGELLTLTIGEEIYDVIDGAAACFDETRALWFARIGSVSVETELSVPETGMKKLLRVRVRNHGETALAGTLAYTVYPVLGRDVSDGSAARCEDFRRGVLFRNRFLDENDGYLYLYAPCGTGAPAPRLRRTAGLHAGGSVAVPLSLNAGGSFETAFCLTFALDRNAAAFLARTPFLPEMRKTALGFSLGEDAPRPFAESFLLWQIRRVRLYARCGPFQCSGAYGFRDQLQDAVNFALVDPEPLKIQLFRCAAAQFPEGDVLHWFHIGIENGEQTVRGVRTHCSDDLLWLPYAAAEYVHVTGNGDILNRRLPFLSPVPLGERERDRYAVCKRSPERATLGEHCMRALERAFRVGAHGLLRMGGGDWNDSFGSVGARGTGESVWLTQFYALTLKRFALLCDTETGEKLMRRAEDLLTAVDDTAWFGDRYARAFYDDGTPMGVAGSGNSEIDLLPQSFAALAGMPDEERVRTGLKTAYSVLYDRKNGIVKLFAPPFDETKKTTGYVNHYPRGVRENGGQYTHAAVWFALALHRAGMEREAKEIMRALDPMRRLGPDGDTGSYRNEPYALSADVYALERYEGRGGWSLYTGAAGWYLRAVWEIFGKY
ncbi:MAG: hypothetical protein IJL26_13925, partial [Clostridia bacterium]|nr:hypothetical protein [Clostridia bacterium]